MERTFSRRWLAGATLSVLLAATSFGLIASAGASHPGNAVAYGPTISVAKCSGTLASSTFVAAPPTGAKGADDLTRLAVAGVDGGKPVIWTAYQNGINPNGTAGAPGGPTNSTVVGYDPATGAVVMTFSVPGKVDGLTADPGAHLLIATVNEDDNSAINLLNPATGTVTHFTYSPSPAVSGNGGTDSIAVKGDQIYVAHSNPNDTKQATEFRVGLDRVHHLALLTPLFYDDSVAAAATGGSVTLALTDPDTNFAMPAATPMYAKTLATGSQGDGKIVFASQLQSGAPVLTVLNLTDNVTGNVPPIDGMAAAGSGVGWLYVVDNKAGTILKLDVTGCTAGTVFVGEPSDNGNPLVGTLNLGTGKITPFANSFQSPKGLLFVP